MINKILLLLVVLITSSCASVSSVYQLSADTFEISSTASPARGGKIGARGMALESAHEHCKSLNKQIEVVKIEVRAGGSLITSELSDLEPGVATVTFMCK